MQTGSSFLLLLALLVGLGDAHNCEDGSRVVCHDIKASSERNAPSSYGEGKAARGYPVQFPDGTKVYCLVDHDYHQCPEGQEPCCLDQSKPLHGHRGAGDKVSSWTYDSNGNATLDGTDTLADHEATSFAAPLLPGPKNILVGLLLCICTLAAGGRI